MKKLNNQIALILLLFAIGVSNLYGQILLKKASLEKQIKNSTLVVEGKVVSKKAFWDVENKNIYTANVIEVYKVFKGQLLLSVNSADISAQKAQVGASIAEATAAFKNAEKDYNRFKALFESNSASQKEMDDMTANYEMAKARLEAANQMRNQVNAQLSYSNITAPFSGVITGKYINAGDMANPGMPLISIENPGKFQVIAMVPESEITSIENGASVEVLIKSTNQILNGTVTEVSTSTKNTGGQYLVKVVLDETDVNLLSGMFASVQFPSEKTSEENSPILIPTSAIIERGELRGVYAVSQSNTALLRWLRLGKQFGDQTEVLSGLSADDKFVLSSESKIVNGSKLNVQ